MYEYILGLLLLCFAFLLLMLQKTYYYFPARELKRQARSGDNEAAAMYRAVAYGASLRLLLWFLIGLAVAGSFLLLSVVAPAWLVFVAVTGAVWYGFAWIPNARVGSLAVRLAVLLTPLLAWILYYTHPFLDFITRNIEHHRPITFHTGLFEREDLIDLIKSQRGIAGSRISDAELDIVEHALSFGEKTVQSIMVPRSQVQVVREQDMLGPILMDELYESGFSRFPVVGADDQTIAGIVYLKDLVADKSGGSVADSMKPSVHFVHEDQTLYQVLHAFQTTKQHLFAVINSDETYVGIITIEDVLEQVIGHKIDDDFDSYEDRRAVAAAGSKHTIPLSEVVGETSGKSIDETDTLPAGDTN
ncbi:MAG TPA: CBS domain-containing protein [Candidatus Saccharimonadales bacterium]|jgi:CBS domain containing-hemolysin-like protein